LIRKLEYYYGIKPSKIDDNICSETHRERETPVVFEIVEQLKTVCNGHPFSKILVYATHITYGREAGVLMFGIFI